MDLSPLISPFYVVFLFLIPLLIITAFLKSAYFKGKFGEFLVNAFLKLFLPKSEYHPINNVTFPTHDGTTQTDHIVVSKFSIFVIETKNLKGSIFGSPNQKTWTQKIYKHTNKFQNPLHQNYKHVKVLEDYLDVDSDSIFSVIVFIGDSTFKTDMPENVTYAWGCVKYIKSRKLIKFKDQEISNIINKITGGILQPSFKTDIQHVSYLKQAKQSPLFENTCPKCGSTLVLR
ncbi:MAG: restriction system protein [Gammaproteobacteria bacterium]|jgi:restriction system protein